jgi:HAE1 family hydrophobic/amphiphilic exporter-1
VNLAAPFIRRPVMTVLVMSAILIFGAMGYRALPVSDLPSVDFPTISVSASLPGANPETMASSVATPLEREFSSIAGLDSMTSTSSQGQAQISLQFSLRRNIDAAAQDVQAAIARAGNRLPEDLPAPPSYRKVNPADQPILYLAVTSETLPLSQLNEYAETLVAQRISMVEGVAQVQVHGSQKYAVRIQADPDRLAANGLGIDDLARAVQASNVNLPTGVLDGPYQALTVEAEGQLTSAGAYRPLIVAYRNGNPVRLDEVARVLDSVENDRAASWLVNRRSIGLAVQRQPGANTVAVVDRVRALLERFRGQLPGSVEISVLFDRSQTIRASVHDVTVTLGITFGLVVLVIFIFLRNVRATLIPTLAIPLSLVGTFAVMYLLNYSLNNLSLMALTLSIGFVVDDAIVVLENIVRHREQGKSAFQAALEGSREIGFTVVSMTLSLAAVFIPFVFLGGLLGRLLTEFAVTIAAAVLLSGFVSLTLSPMMSARLLRWGGHGARGWVYRVTERSLDGLVRAYGAMLRRVLRARTSVLLGSLALLAATVYLYYAIPKGFLPSEDQNRIFIQTEAAEGISFRAMVEHQKAVADVIAADPRVASFSSSVGMRGGSAAAQNSGILFVALVPRSERRESVDEIIQELRPRLARIPGINVYMQNLPPIRLGGALTKAQYQYTVQGTDTGELYQAVPKLMQRLSGLPGFQDVTSDLQLRSPQVRVEIDREKLAALGVTAEQVQLALGSAYGSRRISTMYGSNNQYDVVLEAIPEARADPGMLPLLHVRTAAGQLVPLDALARITRGVGPAAVNHLAQLPAVTVSFNLKPGYSLGPAVEEVQRAAHEVLPAGVVGSFQGTAQVFQASLQGLELLLILSVLVIYLVLGILYESYIHPLTILTALPFAGFGALVTLMLFGMDLNLYAFVGIIMLIGLVKKNGIMMIDFAIDAQRDRHLPPVDAIYEACLVRFRPITMTTLAALMGALPIALGWGAGAESRRPLGLAVVGGLLFSQSLTLFVTPVFYVLMEDLRARWSRGKTRSDEQPRSAASAGPATTDAGRAPDRDAALARR